VLLVAVLLLAGCAGDQAGDGGAVSEPPLSSSPPPTATPPTAPPQSPSDPRLGKDVLVGRVTRGGSGPCFGLETDAGKKYALYSTETLTLKVGETIRVEWAPLRLKIDCGEGEHVSALKISRVG
jgi:hypothetical protein